MEEEKKLELLLRIEKDSKCLRGFRAVGCHYDVKVKKTSFKYNKECRFLGFLGPSEYFPNGYPNDDVGYCLEENCNSTVVLVESSLSSMTLINQMRKKLCSDFTPVETDQTVKVTNINNKTDFLGFLDPNETIEEVYGEKHKDYKIIPMKRKSGTFEELIRVDLEFDIICESNYYLSDKENQSFNGTFDKNDSFLIKSSEMDDSTIEDEYMIESEGEETTQIEAMSDYERIRLENIKERKQFMVEMGFFKEKKTEKKNNLIKVKINKARAKRLSHPKRRSIRMSNVPNNFLKLPYDCVSDDDDGDNKNKVLMKRPNSYGAISGVPIGEWWATRIECNRAGIHRPTVAGIHPGPKGAYSVVLSGGYDDDIDNGESFTYSGSGGRDLKGTKINRRNLRTAPQSKDQTLDHNNASLVYSCEHHKPVRVIRGFKLKSSYAPEKGYRYDGLYEIEKWWLSKGISGFLTYKFKFKRLDNQNPPPWLSEDNIPEASSTYKEE